MTLTITLKRAAWVLVALSAIGAWSGAVAGNTALTAANSFFALFWAVILLIEYDVVEFEL